jgi:hypothetical protein
MREPPARRRSAGVIAAIAIAGAAAIGGGIYIATRPSDPRNTRTASSDERAGRHSTSPPVATPTSTEPKAGEAKPATPTTTEARAGEGSSTDSRTGDSRTGDSRTGKPGSKPDPRTKPNDPKAGAHPSKPDSDDDLEGDEEIRQKLKQAAAAIERRDYDQAERIANSVINAPASPRQHATARMIHGTVQCAARNDQEAAGIDLRNLDNFRNLKNRLLTVCRSHGIFTAR